MLQIFESEGAGRFENEGQSNQELKKDLKLDLSKLQKIQGFKSPNKFLSFQLKQQL